MTSLEARGLMLLLLKAVSMGNSQVLECSHSAHLEGLGIQEQLV